MGFWGERGGVGDVRIYGGGLLEIVLLFLY